MSDFKLYPYKVGSASVKKLKEALEAVIIKTEGSKYRYRDSHTVINWGNSRRNDNMIGVPMINEPENVAIAANKLSTFEELEEAGVPTVPYTTTPSEAVSWLNEGSRVFVRNSLTGHSGEGIAVVEPAAQVNEVNEFQSDVEQILTDLFDEAETTDDKTLLGELIDSYHLNATPTRGVAGSNTIATAPLYTKAVQNNGEYRVHVFKGEVILYQKKSRRVDDNGDVVTAEGEEADVRNLASNWVYRTGNLKKLERVEELAINAIEALGLDFGAVDIIMDENGDVFVLEINTAAGLGNTDTLQAYVEAFNSLVE